MRPFTLAIDFDNTLVQTSIEDNFRISGLLPHARTFLDWANQTGLYIIIWTARTGQMLIDAKNFLDQNNIKYNKINENADFLDFETSQKIYYDCLIDDKGVFVDQIDWLQIKDWVAKKYMSKIKEEADAHKMDPSDDDFKINYGPELKTALFDNHEYPENTARPQGRPGYHGMGESVQKMYEGPVGENTQKHYDQLGVMSGERDWIDDEAIINQMLLMYASSIKEEDYVYFGDVSRKKLGQQTQYTSRYLDGANGEYPNLGEGLRIEGDPRDYHRVMIHKDDVSEFIKRYIEYQKNNKLSNKQADMINRRPYMNDWSYYYSAPKGSEIPEAVLAPNEQVIKQILEGNDNNYTILDSETVKRTPFVRDEINKFHNVESPLNNVFYWGKTQQWK